MVVMYLASPNFSISSSILGMGCASNVDMAFNARKSIQKRVELSGLGTITMGDDHSLEDGRMTPRRNISWTSFCTAALFAAGMRYGFCFTIFPGDGMFCQGGLARGV